MQELGVDEVYIDRMSGKNIQRPEFAAVVSEWRQRHLTAVEAMRRLEMKPSTFYRKVRVKRARGAQPAEKQQALSSKEP